MGVERIINTCKTVYTVLFLLLIVDRIVSRFYCYAVLFNVFRLCYDIKILFIDTIEIDMWFSSCLSYVCVVFVS